MNNEENIQEMVEQARALADYNPDAPVILTQKEVDASEERRKRKPRTVCQLPVYRAASNLAFCIAQVEAHCPRKMRCFVDELEDLTTELLRYLVLANEFRSERLQFCTECYAIITTVSVKLEIAFRVGALGKDEWHKIKRMADSATAQVVGWRNSAIKQGM